MKNGNLDIGTISTLPAWGDGIMLFAIWQVDKGPEYQVNRCSNKISWILLRTLAGKGRLELTDGTVYEIESGTIILLDNRLIRHYGTIGSSWRFDWYEFVSATSPLKPGVLLRLPDEHFEMEVREQLALLLRQQDSPRSAAASVLLGWLMRWYAIATGNSTFTRDHRIDAAIEMMGRHLSQPLTIAELARRQGMCDRSFRSLFCKETGTSPKVFYNRLRFKLAGEMLASGEYNVEQTADRLGFSSPFHFSIAFKRHFGAAPSHYRRK